MLLDLFRLLVVMLLMVFNLAMVGFITYLQHLELLQYHLEVQQYNMLLSAVVAAVEMKTLVAAAEQVLL